MSVDEQTKQMTSFIRFFSNYINNIEKEMSRSTFNFNEIRIIFDVLETDGLTARDIEEELDLDKGYTSRLIKKLLDQNIIVKDQSEEDKRLYHLSLSPDGRKIAIELYEQYHQIIGDDLKNLSKKDQDMLLKSIATIESLSRRI